MLIKGKMFNEISIIFGLTGGFIIDQLGGNTKMITLLLTVIIIDYVTGLLKAWYKKEMSSKIGKKGLITKFEYIIIVFLVAKMDLDPIVCNSFIAFFISNELISILENTSEFIKLPKNLKDVLLQVRSEKD